MTMKKLRVAIIADELTTACLSRECLTAAITPLNYWWVIRFWRPDLIFVESAWRGRWRSWSHKIATQWNTDTVYLSSLGRVVDLAREYDIPCVFWNKEDSVHFSRFCQSAILFDYIFTVDENCVEAYQKIVPAARHVGVLPFPVQTSVHNFQGQSFQFNSANFVGSYSRHVHDKRRAWQDLMFNACAAAGMQVTAYDRNSRRISSNYRFPSGLGIVVKSAVSHDKTADIYRKYLVSLNVNTIEDSPSMYSRRLVEILACGGIALTNPTPAVDRYFGEYCHVIRDAASAEEILKRLKRGPQKQDLEMARAGANYVAKAHTWTQRLADICKIVGV